MAHKPPKNPFPTLTWPKGEFADEVDKLFVYQPVVKLADLQ